MAIVKVGSVRIIVILPQTAEKISGGCALNSGKIPDMFSGLPHIIAAAQLSSALTGKETLAHFVYSSMSEAWSANFAPNHSTYRFYSRNLPA